MKYFIHIKTNISEVYLLFPRWLLSNNEEVPKMHNYVVLSRLSVLLSFYDTTLPGVRPSLSTFSFKCEYHPNCLIPFFMMFWTYPEIFKKNYVTVFPNLTPRLGKSTSVTTFDYKCDYLWNCMTTFFISLHDVSLWCSIRILQKL